MNIPEGMTEQQLVDIIDVVADRLAYKFKFGYHGTDDMKQEAKLLAIKVLNKDKWDGVRPLENFLYTCVHNLLYNNKRDNFERLDKPCLGCPLYDKQCLKSESQCEKYEEKLECDLFAAWITRNESKKNIMKPIDIGGVQDNGEKNMRSSDHTEHIETKEVWELIDKHLDIKLRADYIKLRNNIKIPKQRRLLIEEAVLEITKGYYDRDDE